MINIPLQEFILEVPNVNGLRIAPVGTPELDPNLGIVQPVYYTLNKVDGRDVERGNKSIPIDVYNLINKYVSKTITESDITTLNAFFVLADWPLVAILPVDEEEQPEQE